MLPGRFTLVGSVLLAAGMLIVGLAIAVGGDFATTALAGEDTNTPTNTSVPTVRLKTHTPISTNTAAATSTEVPATPAPVHTQAPAPTQPGGGTEGVGVKPPNTGSGSGSAGPSGASLWLLLGGIAVAATGGGAVLVGVRRRS